MKSIEKLILVAISFLALSKIAAILNQAYFVFFTGEQGPTILQKVLSQQIYFILYSIVNVGSSIWLFVESRKAEMKVCIWTLFGLFFGLMAVVIFYLSGIYNQLKYEGKQGST